MYQSKTLKIVDPFTSIQRETKIQPMIQYAQLIANIKTLLNLNCNISALRDVQNNVIDELSLAFLPDSAVIYVVVDNNGGNDWRIDSNSMAMYQDEFKRHVDHTGTLSGQQVRNLLVVHDLNMQDLAKIWDLSHLNGGVTLSMDEYCVARYLVDARKKGISLPNNLPPSLIDSIKQNQSPVPPLSMPTNKWQNDSFFPTGPVSPQSAPQSFPSSNGWTTPSLSSSAEIDFFPHVSVQAPSTPQPNHWDLDKFSMPTNVQGSHWDFPSSVQVEVPSWRNQAPVIENIQIPMKNNTVDISPSSPRKNKKSDIWTISRSQKKKYQVIFDTYNENGVISATSGRGILSKTGLDNTVLAKVWNLADSNKPRGQLCKEELFIALHLVYLVGQGISVPESVPESLSISAHSGKRVREAQVDFKGFREMSRNAKTNEPISLTHINVKRYYPNDISKIECIGGGTFSKVWKVSIDDQICAVKEMESASQEEVEMWKKEIELMAYTQKNQNLVNIRGYLYTDNTFSIIMEYMENGSLYDLIHVKKVKWNIFKKLRMLIQISNGLQSIHSINVIHRDLKSMNILVNANDDVKIADWGCSRTVNLEIMTVGVGSPLWMAPEVVSSHSYSFPSDIFSFGVVIFEILHEGLPKFNKKIRKVVFPSEYLGQNIITQCTLDDPSSRPLADYLVEYFKSLVLKFLETCSVYITSSITSHTPNTVLPQLHDQTNWLKYLIDYNPETITEILQSSGTSMNF